MTTLQPISQLLIQLTLPIQDMARLSFCDGSREASVKAWVESLPLTQMQFVSGLLYQALPDIARFRTNPSNRVSILEKLRIPALQTTEGLAQTFLNQPLILPDAAVKTATVAQALQKHLINGYLVAARDFCKEIATNKELLALSIHRAISGIGLVLLRSYQLYIPVSARTWTELHALYQLAMQLKLTNTPVPDDLPHHQHANTIALAYTRTLLLACARPNQLRQDEILATYNALDLLSTLIKLQQAGEHGPDSLFAVDLNSNHGPLYRSRFNQQEREFLLEIDTSRLCNKLQEFTSGGTTNSDERSWRNELNFSPALTAHLIQTWNVLSQRNFERRQANGCLDVTIGFSNIHFYTTGGLSFAEFLNQSDIDDGDDLHTIGTIFKKRGAQLKTPPSSIDDPWTSTDDNAASEESAANIKAQDSDGLCSKTNPFYRVPLIDTSLGGYCIEWRDEIPNQVKAGELLGLREPTRNRWSLGVVRWVNQTKGATQLGIQVLAPQVTPIGLAITHKNGESSEYSRALELPAFKAINQEATLVANAVSFREYCKVRVYRRTNDANLGPNEQAVQLTRRLFATGAFSQFTYRDLNAEKATDAERRDDFDAVWD